MFHIPSFAALQVSHKRAKHIRLHYPFLKLPFVKPYQLANPITAKILIVGQDANWPKVLNLKQLKAYFSNTRKFWYDNYVHHPSMIFPDSAGNKYHATLMRILPDWAVISQTSLIEIFPLPTIEGTKLKSKDIKIFISNDVAYKHFLTEVVNDDSKLVFATFAAANALRHLKILNYAPRTLFSPKAKGIFRIAHPARGLTVRDTVEMRRLIYQHLAKN